MSALANISIKAKILSIVVPLCVVGLGAAGSMAYFFKNADNTYSEFLATDSVAAIHTVRAATAMVSVPYSAYQLVAYDNADPGYAGIKAFYDSSKTDIVTRLEKVAALVPENAVALKEFKDRAQAIFDSIDKAVKTDLDGKAPDAAKMLAQIDPAVDKWRADLRAYNDANQAALLKSSDEMSDMTDRTIMLSLGAVGFAFLMGIVLSLYVATRGITGPIARLRERMAGLASGDTASKIEGLERKDEIGSMANAVLVFQQNAVERIRLEQETEANRSMSERERIEREKQKAKEAADVQFAVDNLAAALAKLSDGDVSYRIREPFAATLDGVRNDFNQSADKLQAALRSVSENARGIDAGSSEIKAAADDLAKRTEQQAAAVEETAAALEEITTTVRDSTRRAQEADSLSAAPRPVRNSRVRSSARRFWPWR